MSQNIQNTQNHIYKTGGTQPLAAGKQPVGMLSQPKSKVLTVLPVL